MIGKKMMGAGLAAGLGALYMGTRDRNNSGLPISNKAFKEIKEMGDAKGAIDVGRFLSSKAFNEWLYSEYNPMFDDNVVSNIYQNILRSYPDKNKGMQVATQFMNVVVNNKPNYKLPNSNMER